MIEDSFFGTVDLYLENILAQRARAVALDNLTITLEGLESQEQFNEKNKIKTARDSVLVMLLGEVSLDSPLQGDLHIWDNNDIFYSYELVDIYSFCLTAVGRVELYTRNIKRS